MEGHPSAAPALWKKGYKEMRYGHMCVKKINCWTKNNLQSSEGKWILQNSLCESYPLGTSSPLDSNSESHSRSLRGLNLYTTENYILRGWHASAEGHSGLLSCLFQWCSKVRVFAVSLFQVRCAPFHLAPIEQVLGLNQWSRISHILIAPASPRLIHTCTHIYMYAHTDTPHFGQQSEWDRHPTPSVCPRLDTLPWESGRSWRCVLPQIDFKKSFLKGNNAEKYDNVRSEVVFHLLMTRGSFQFQTSLTLEEL